MAQNMEVGALQAHLQQTGAKWRAGATTLSSLSPAQRRARLGWVPPPGEPTIQEREQAAKAKHAAAPAPTAGAAPAPTAGAAPAPTAGAAPAPTAGAAPAPTAGAAVAAYPASIDLRNVNGSNYITPIKDQGNCGSCVAFGTTATVEGTLRWQSSDPNLGVDLSEAQLFYCIGGPAGINCETGWNAASALSAYQNSGIADEACFPYTAGDQPCNLCSNSQSRLTKITGWHYVGTAADMKTWLSTRGPLVTRMSVYDDFFHYAGGVYTQTSTNLVGGHCVCVVGYDDTSGCWICKNSWGTAWGESGFFRIAYGQCGIDYNMLAVEGVSSQNFKISWLSTGNYLGVNNFLVSDNRQYFAIMQGDGNFVLYRGSDPTHQGAFCWNSGVAPGQGQYFAVLQNDANFVIYKGSSPWHQGAFVWNTGTVNGQVTVHNQGGYVARCSVDYDFGGQHHSESSGNFPIAQSYSVVIPVGARNIHVVCQDATGLVWDPWKTILDLTYATPPRITFTLTGTTLNPSYSSQ
jgi:C1A family cysteine protease